MSQPKSVVQALVNYPYKQELPDTLPGLNSSSAQGSIRIVSVQKPIEDYSSWKQWKSANGDVWVDLVKFKQPYAATSLLELARQPHSGYYWANQLLLFSGTGDASKEAVGTALITPDGSLLNVGVKLPLAVSWNKPLSDADRKNFNAALEKFQNTLDMLAKQFLDPTYVSFSPRIEVKPESLRLLRMGGFARLWSYVKYNFVYLDRRRDLNWDAVLDQYLPRVAEAKDDIEYGRLLEQAVALLKDGHTSVYPNTVEPRDSPLILLEPVDGKPVASIVGKLPELQQIEPGMELLSIDEIPVRTVVERDLDPYIASVRSRTGGSARCECCYKDLLDRRSKPGGSLWTEKQSKYRSRVTVQKNALPSKCLRTICLSIESCQTILLISSSIVSAIRRS